MMDNKYVGRHSTSLIIKDKQIKNAMRYYFIPVGMVTMEGKEIIRVVRIWRKRVP